MTDKEVLFSYRMKQAEETLSDAQKMLEGDFSIRSVVNRAYYAMFYAVLALFIKNDIDLRTSKHAGVIATFDKNFIQTNRLPKDYSKIFHKLFDARQESDYKELVDIPKEEAQELVKQAQDFLAAIKQL